MRPPKQRSPAAAWLALPLAAATLACLVGCEDKVQEMSDYPYYLRVMNERWEIARASLKKSDDPKVARIGFVVVLLKDMEGAAGALEWKYNEPNRDQAIAKLKEVAKSFRKDLDDKVDMTGATVVLKPGATVKDVAGAVERAYEDYLEFKPMVAVKK